MLLGNGDGTFGAHVEFMTSTAPEEIAIGDFNGDGGPDLVTANPSGDNISVLLGTGGGLFAPHADFSTGLSPTMVVVGDFDQDGNEDVGVSALGSDAVSILLGNGDGTFGPGTDFSTAAGPAALAQGDFNGDGILDLVTANIFADSASVLLGNGDGTFAPRIDLETIEHPIPTRGAERFLQVAVGDFNADGSLDFLTADPTTQASIFAAELILRLGNGDGTFGANFRVLPLANPTGIATGDFNADGKMDVVITDGPNDAINILLQSPFFLDQRSLNFALQSPGTTSPPQSVTVQNTGSLPLTISSVALTADASGATIDPADVDQFSITGDTCTSAPIPPGGDCAIPVGFLPATTGSKAATLIVKHEAFRDAPDSFSFPPSVNLTGRAGVPPFDFGDSPTPQTIAAGQSALFGIEVLGAPDFSAAVSLFCGSGLPQGATCSFNPASVNLGGGAATTILTVTTAQRVAAVWLQSSIVLVAGLFMTLVVPAALAFLAHPRPRRRWPWLPRIGGYLIVVAMMVACGGGSGDSAPTPGMGGTPAGAYTIEVTGMSGSISRTGNVALVVN